MVATPATIESAGDAEVVLTTENIAPTGAEADVTYESSDETLGVISGSSLLVVDGTEGTVTVTGTDVTTGVTSTVDITVVKPEPVLTSFDLTSDITNPKVDDVATISVNNIVEAGAVVNVTLASSDESVATVSGMTVSFIGGGDVTITGTDVDTGISNVIDFTVNAELVSFGINVVEN